MRRFHSTPIAGSLALVLGLLLFPLALWAAPSSQTTNPPPSGVDDTLENMTYLSEYTESGEVTLEDGIYNDTENMIYVMLANAPRAYGDVDGDGDLDAVVWMATNTGGSGVFVDLAVVLDVEGDATNVATTFLGDRTQVQAIEIAEDGTITLRVISHSETDPMCCPTQNVELTYVLQGDQLVETSSTVLGTEGDATAEAGATMAGDEEPTAATPVPPSEPAVVATPDPFATPWANPFAEGVLENSTYQTVYFDEGEVTLVDGEFDDDVNRIYYQLLPEPQAFGDLNGDGNGDAAVLLAANFGGSGVFVSLHAMLNEDGVADNVAALVLGDRVQPQSLEITWDGVIVLTMIQHDADDPMCCPTEEVTLRYVLEGDQLVTAPEVAPVPADASGAPLDPGTGNINLFNPSGDPLVALVKFEIADELLPNPALVSLVPGPGNLTPVDALYLAQGCEGWITASPDVVVELASDQDELRLFTVGGGDPTLVVVTPGGEIICNDDVVDELFNPLVLIDDAKAGRYAVYAGVFDIDAAPVRSLLIATTHAYDPQNFSVVINAPEPTSTPVVTGTLEPSPNPTLTLSPAEMPYTQEATAGGRVNLFEQNLGNPLCTGWTSAEPALSFVLSGDAESEGALVVFYEGSLDTTLIVSDPSGRYHCADDSAEDTNWNPRLSMDYTPGNYSVWVGTYNQGESSSGALTVTNDSTAVPVMLEKR